MKHYVLATILGICCVFIADALYDLVTHKNRAQHIQSDRNMPYAYSANTADGWYTGKDKMLLQDESGQVYLLDQMGTNSNMYTVWQLTNATNGITNTFVYRMGWLTNGGNYFENPDGTGNVIGPVGSVR